MKIINNSDRQVHFIVVGDGSQTLWEGDVSQGAATEKSIPQSIYYLATTFKCDPPLDIGSTIGTSAHDKLTDKSTVTIEDVYCGATFTSK